MVFQKITKHTPSIHHPLGLEQLIPVIVEQRLRVSLPFLCVHIMECMAEIENGAEIPILTDHRFHFFRPHLVIFPDGKRIGRQERTLLHLPEDLRKPVHIVDVVKGQIISVRAIRRKVRIRIVFLQMADGIQTEASQPHIHPLQNHFVYFFSQLRIFPVQIRLFFGENM